jgi:amidohydrolase
MGFVIAPELRRLVDQEIAKVLPLVTAFRHERHQQPELTWKEEATAKAVAARLREIPGLAVREGVGRLGVVAVLEGDAPGPTVALRADMDALPIKEATGLSYCSAHPGVMHACGHDGHMANLLGSALVLSTLKSKIRGRVKLIFQPAEEGGAGADVMSRAGALDDPKVDVIFGLHGWPELACGRIYVGSGPFMAATSNLKIAVRGTGCHAAMPHLGTDQVLIAARIIEGLQSVASRITAPTEPVVVSITRVLGGAANNVIPPVVELAGTLRTLNVTTRDAACAAIQRLVTGIAAANGASATVEIDHGYPPTVNDDRSTVFLEEVAAAVLPPGHASRIPAPSMGGEDFAFFLQRVPGAYFFLGVDDGRPGGYPSLHHPGYDFNDAALPTGIRMFVHAALAYADA